MNRKRVFLVFVIILLIAAAAFTVSQMNQMTAGQQSQIDAFLEGNSP